MQFSLLFITALVVAVSATPLPQIPEKPIQIYQVDPPSGGEGGTEFSDLGMLQGLSDVPIITSFGTRGGERVNKVSLVGFVNGTTTPYESSHGGNGGHGRELLLPAGEWIEYMEVQVAKKGWHQWSWWGVTLGKSYRVFYIKVHTNLGNWADAGKYSDDRQVTPYRPPPGYTRLVGFTGRQGANVDKLGPIWA